MPPADTAVAMQTTYKVHCDTAEARSARCLVHIRAMVAVLVAVHVGIFIIVVVAAASVGRTVNYYQTYLQGPLSGPNVATTVSDGMSTMHSVHDMATLASGMAYAGAASLGFDANATAAPAVARRTLLQLPANDTLVEAALAGVLDALRLKITQFDAAAPGNFLTWVTQTTPGPYVRQLLQTARYGEATMGSVLRAFGTTVDINLAGPDLVAAAEAKAQRKLQEAL